MCRCLQETALLSAKVEAKGLCNGLDTRELAPQLKGQKGKLRKKKGKKLRINMKTK